MIGGNEGVSILVNKALEAQNTDHYYSLYTNLRTICMAMEENEHLLELDEFFENVPITLRKLEYYYRLASENPGSRRKIIFSDIGPVTFEEIQGMYDQFVVMPLNLISARIIGNVSQNSGVKLQKTINAKATTFLSAMNSTEPEVILD